MFKIRHVAIDTYPENMAFQLRAGGDYGAEQFQTLRKIVICHDGSGIAPVLATDTVPGPVATISMATTLAGAIGQAALIS